MFAMLLNVILASEGGAGEVETDQRSLCKTETATIGDSWRLSSTGKGLADAQMDVFGFISVT